ncbi:MAG: hypothetical protein R3208_11825 [Ketobacteraceae bacterium]|nr:hypothetical protein [Ketobacteraceae bacterium]
MTRKLISLCLLLAALTGCKETATYIESAGNIDCAIHKNTVSCWGDYTVERPEGGFETVDVSLKESYVKPRIAVGLGHVCVLDEGTVDCFLDNTFGQTEVPELVNPVDIAAGPKFTCALDQSEIVCWGDTEDLNSIPLPRTLSNPTRIVAGMSHVCALDDLGVACQGYNIFTDGDPNPPFAIQPGKITSSAGASATCGFEDQWYCWGEVSYPHPQGLEGFDVVIPSFEQACGIRNGKVECWGETPLNTEFLNDRITNPVALSVGFWGLCVIANQGVVCEERSGTVPDYLQ